MSASELGTAPWTVDETAYPAGASIAERARFLLRYAVLAPSSHNSQPWSFAVFGDTVEVYPDESRWLEAADPDRRELHLGLGCAVENLVVAAAHFGLATRVGYAGDSPESEAADAPLVSVTLDPDGDPDSRLAALFGALTDRRTEHGAFEDRPLPASTLDRLRDLADDPGVDLVLVEGGRRADRLAELQAEADERLMDDPAYRRELGHWVGIGALGASWLAARIGQVAVTLLDLGEREGRKNSALLRSAPVVAVLATDGDAVADRVRAGQVFERLALAATPNGVAVHPMSQTLERSASKAEVADLLGLDRATPQHLFRMGYPVDDGGDGHTPRWPVSAVLR